MAIHRKFVIVMLNMLLEVQNNLLHRCNLIFSNNCSELVVIELGKFCKGFNSSILAWKSCSFLSSGFMHPIYALTHWTVCHPRPGGFGSFNQLDARLCVCDCGVYHCLKLSFSVDLIS